MPTPRETISQTQAGDYTQTTSADLEDGTVRVVVNGPAGSVDLDAGSAQEIEAQLAPLAAAITAARAALDPLVEDERSASAR